MSPNFPFPEPGQLVAPLRAYALAYGRWLERQISRGRDAIDAPLSVEQRKALLADWLRDLVAAGDLHPHDRLPAYVALGETFALSVDQVASVVRRLRQEQVLAKRQIGRASCRERV